MLGKLSALPTDGLYGASPVVLLIATEPMTKSTSCWLQNYAWSDMENTVCMLFTYHWNWKQNRLA